jgi:glycosyltransferase involved in cell wall biosynthesis
MKKIEIHQFLPSFSPRDAIGNEAILMRDELRALGHDSEIFCEHRHRALRNQAIEVSGPKMPDLGQNILIFHFSVATGALLRLAHSKSSICLRYHNITPEIFFDPVKDASTYAVCKLGRRQLPMAASIARWGLADSAFNAEDLKFCQMSKINVLPLFRDYEGIANAPRDPSLEGSLKSRGDRKTILFVGRLAPNKCQQDLIQLLKVYHDCVSRNLRLILIGSSYSLGFYNALKEFAKELGLSVAEGSALNGDFDVLFAGGVSDSELATYFSAADAFVCASEHEAEASIRCLPFIRGARHRRHSSRCCMLSATIRARARLG